MHAPKQSKGPKAPKAAPKQPTKQSVPLKQGKRDSTAAPPVRYGQSLETYFHVSSIKSPKFRNAIRVRGQDFVQQVATPATGDAPGTTLAEVYISPNELGFSRLAQFAKLYEKFLFTDFKVKWVPAVGTNTNGEILIAPDRDIEDPTPTGGEMALRQFMSWEGAKAFPPWKPEVVNVPLESPETGFYTSPNGSDDREQYQGQVYVATVNPVAVSGGANIGTIWIEYDLLLFVPQLEVQPCANQYSSVTVAPQLQDALYAYQPAFTPVRGVNNDNIDVKLTSLAGVGALDLAEGLYDMMLLINQTAAGTVSIGNPTVTAKAPAPAGAPQPYVKQLANTTTNSANTTAVRRQLVSVPKGGATLTQLMNSVTGVTATSGQQMIIGKIMGFLPKAGVDALYA